MLLDDALHGPVQPVDAQELLGAGVDALLQKAQHVANGLQLLAVGALAPGNQLPRPSLAQDTGRFVDRVVELDNKLVEQPAGGVGSLLATCSKFSSQGRTVDDVASAESGEVGNLQHPQHMQTDVGKPVRPVRRPKFQPTAVEQRPDKGVDATWVQEGHRRPNALDWPTASSAGELKKYHQLEQRIDFVGSRDQGPQQPQRRDDTTGKSVRLKLVRCRALAEGVAEVVVEVVDFRLEAPGWPADRDGLGIDCGTGRSPEVDVL
ncbi:MAG: hypothetical protein EXR77_19500 [Myxococcales bacterium]|nr:hypothetical protein [Myxococcales bacterium]